MRDARSRGDQTSGGGDSEQVIESEGLGDERDASLGQEGGEIVKWIIGDSLEEGSAIHTGHVEIKNE